LALQAPHRGEDEIIYPGHLSSRRARPPLRHQAGQPRLLRLRARG
jgi:hypothetical protein